MEVANLIKKKKKLETIEKVSGQGFEGAKKVPGQGFDGAKKMPTKEEDLEVTKKVKSSPTDKSLEISVMLEGSKKKKTGKENAYDKSVGEFEVEKDSSGMFKETGEEKLKKLLKRRGY